MWLQESEYCPTLSSPSRTSTGSAHPSPCMSARWPAWQSQIKSSRMIYNFPFAQYFGPPFTTNQGWIPVKQGLADEDRCQSVCKSVHCVCIYIYIYTVYCVISLGMQLYSAHNGSIRKDFTVYKIGCKLIPALGHEHRSSTLSRQTSLMSIQTTGLVGEARKCLSPVPFLCIFLNSLWPTMSFSGDISLPPLYLGVIVWIRRDCIYSDSRGANWQGNKWPDNQHHSDPSQRRNKSKKKSLPASDRPIPWCHMW